MEENEAPILASFSASLTPPLASFVVVCRSSDGRDNKTNKVCADLFLEQIQISCWQWIIMKDVELWTDDDVALPEKQQLLVLTAAAACATQWQDEGQMSPEGV